jgi:acyl carrier protein
MGMSEFAEPRIRRLVADYLGVSADELTPEVSLTDDLAADSLDLVELALALEGEFGIEVPERTIDEVRTYGDLVETAAALTRGQRARETSRASAPAIMVWSRVVPAGPEAGSGLQRADELTPYSAEEIGDDALRAGRGARLEVTVPAGTNDAGVAWVQDQFAWLGKRGVNVSVHRDHPDARGERPHAVA